MLRKPLGRRPVRGRGTPVGRRGPVPTLGRTPRRGRPTLGRTPIRGRPTLGRTPTGRTPIQGRTPAVKIQPESKRKPAKRVSPKMQAYLERMFKARKKSTPKSKPPVQGEVIKAATPKRGQQARRVPKRQDAARAAAAANRRVMSRALAPKKRG